MAFVGLDEHPKLCRADDLREAEAADVATTVQKAVTEGWSVRDDDLHDWRPATGATSPSSCRRARRCPCWSGP